MYNKTNAKLGNVLVTWPCVCDGSVMVGKMGGGWLGGMGGMEWEITHQ